MTTPEQPSDPAADAKLAAAEHGEAQRFLKLGGRAGMWVLGLLGAGLLDCC